MKPVKKAVRVIQPSAPQFDVPSSMKTTWTSHEPLVFKKILESLSLGIDGVRGDPPAWYFGFRHTMAEIHRSSVNIFCVIAVIDGDHTGEISRLAHQCHLNGIPLVLGRGARELGKIFEKKNRVCCVALSRYCVSKHGMEDFVMGVNSVSSKTRIPLEENLDVIEQFRGRVSGKRKNGDEKKQHGITAPVHQPQVKKIKQNTPKKNFFSSFD